MLCTGWDVSHAALFPDLCLASGGQSQCSAKDNKSWSGSHLFMCFSDNAIVVTQDISCESLVSFKEKKSR